MNRLFLSIGLAVSSSLCSYAAHIKLDPYHMQIVSQYMERDLMNVGPAIESPILNLIQVNKKYRSLLDRKRINSAPINGKNYKRYSNIQTQELYGNTDRIMWNDNIVKYICDVKKFCGQYSNMMSNVIARAIKNGKPCSVLAIVDDDDAYITYYIPNGDDICNFIKGGYVGIRGGFLLTKCSIGVFPIIEKRGICVNEDSVDECQCSKLKEAICLRYPSGNVSFVYVDDEGVTSPVSDINDHRKITHCIKMSQGCNKLAPNETYVDKVLLRRIEFRNLCGLNPDFYQSVVEERELKVLFDNVNPVSNITFSNLNEFLALNKVWNCSALSFVTSILELEKKNKTLSPIMEIVHGFFANLLDEHKKRGEIDIFKLNGVTGGWIAFVDFCVGIFKCERVYQDGLNDVVVTSDEKGHGLIDLSFAFLNMLGYCWTRFYDGIAAAYRLNAADNAKDLDLIYVAGNALYSVWSNYRLNA